MSNKVVLGEGEGKEHPGKKENKKQHPENSEDCPDDSRCRIHRRKCRFGYKLSRLCHYFAHLPNKSLKMYYNIGCQQRVVSFDQFKKVLFILIYFSRCGIMNRRFTERDCYYEE